MQHVFNLAVPYYYTISSLLSSCFVCTYIKELNRSKNLSKNVALDIQGELKFVIGFGQITLDTKQTKPVLV